MLGVLDQYINLCDINTIRQLYHVRKDFVLYLENSNVVNYLREKLHIKDGCYCFDDIIYFHDKFMYEFYGEIYNKCYHSKEMSILITALENGKFRIIKLVIDKIKNGTCDNLFNYYFKDYFPEINIETFLYLAEISTDYFDMDNYCEIFLINRYSDILNSLLENKIISYNMIAENIPSYWRMENSFIINSSNEEIAKINNNVITFINEDRNAPKGEIGVIGPVGQIGDKGCCETSKYETFKFKTNVYQNRSNNTYKNRAYKHRIKNYNYKR